MDTENRVVENEQRSKSNTHRLDRLEKRVDEQDKLVTAICGLQKEMEHTKQDERRYPAEQAREALGRRGDGNHHGADLGAGGRAAGATDLTAAGKKKTGQPVNFERRNGNETEQQGL